MAGASEDNKAARKVQFCREAVESRDRFADCVVLDEDLHAALHWIKSRTAVQVQWTL